MSKVGIEFLPDINKERSKELRQQLKAKQLAWLEADRGKDKDLADRLAKEKEHLMIELRMADPNIELTTIEEIFIDDADYQTKLLHYDLNKKKKSKVN